MIVFLKGRLAAVHHDSVWLEVYGVGYQVLVPSNLLAKLPPLGEEVLIYTCLHVREDSLSLYGFLSLEERLLFLLLIGVSGIGPRGALNILSAMPATSLMEAIVNENTAVLTEISGIGTKTARRLVLELKDKMTDTLLPVRPETGGANALLDALEALKALGYNLSEIERLVRQGQQELGPDLNATDLISYVLKKIGRKE